MLLWQLAHFRCGSWRIFVVAVGGNAKLQKTTRAKGIFREIRCTFREIKSYILHSNILQTHYILIFHVKYN